MNVINIVLLVVGLLLAAAGIGLTTYFAVTTAAANKSNLRRYNNRYNTNDGAQPPEKIRANKKPLALAAAGLVLFLAAFCFRVVPTGYTGVRTTFGLIDQESCMPGFNLVTPFAQSISLVNNKQQDLRFEDRVWAETKEQTVVYMEGVQVTYQIVPESSAWIYANVENWIEKLVDQDITASALKSAARELGADEVTDRAKIQDNARRLLQAAVDDKYGPERVIIKNVIINNMDFDESYNAAIAKKSQAIQEQQEQAIRNQTNVDKAKAEAEAERQKAQGQADAELIRANAKAEANKAIANSITDATQRQDAIDKWDGVLPRYAGDGATFGILDAADVPTAAPAQ